MRILAHRCLLLTLVVAACASPPPTPTPTPSVPRYTDCHVMAEVAARAARARDLGTGQEEVVASAMGELGDSKAPPDRVRLFAKRVFDAPVPPSLAGADAYSACLAHRDGIGDLALTTERVDALVSCSERAAQGGALSCGYAEAVARATPNRAFVPIPTAQQLDKIRDVIKGSLVQVESSEGMWIGAVAPSGAYAMVRAHHLKLGDEVLVFPAGSPEQRRTSRVVGVTPKYRIAVIAPAPANVQPVRMVDQEALIHGQPLVVLHWDSERLAARLVAVAHRARQLGGACFPTYVEMITEVTWPEIDGPVFDQEGRLVAFGAYYVETTRDVPLYLNLGISAMTFAQIADRVHQYGYWRYGQIGVTVQETTPELADALRVPVREGALVNNVESRGPAGKAGLRRGDVIVAVNGKRLTSGCDLIMHLAPSNPGDVLRLAVRRQSSRLTIDVTAREGKDLSRD